MFNRLPLAVLVTAFALAVLPAAASAAAPSNDDFANAAPLSVGTDVSGTNLDATAEAQEPTPGTGRVTERDCTSPTDGSRCTTSVWYTFQPSSSDTYVIETCDGGTDLDTVVAVWTGSLGSLSEVASNDDASVNDCPGAAGHASRLSFAATGGTTYHVEVSGYNATQGSFYLRAYPDGSPPAAAPDTAIGSEDSYAAGALEVNSDTVSGGRHTASFDFTSADAGATFQCSLDGAAFAACSSPVSYDGLAGGHTFAVRALAGGKVDPTPAIQRFTVDNDPPDTSFTSVPSSPSSDTDLIWSAGGSERQPAFMCSIDGSPTTSNCDFDNEFGPFCNASHEFRIAELDQALNLDPTPAISDVTETGGTGCTSPTMGTISSHAASGTEQDLSVPLDSGGYGGTLHLDYGTTTAYGSSMDHPVLPGASSGGFDIALLQPATLYHYRVRLTTPGGTTESGDHVFATEGATGPVPSVVAGTPVAVGNHAAAIPLTLNGHGGAINQYGVLIDPAGAPTLSSPFVYEETFVPASSSPVARTLDVVDLEPGTYRVRAFAWSIDDQEGSASPEFTLTVPTQPAPPISAPLPPQSPSTPHFVLKRSAIRVGKITRHSKFVILTLKGLPPHSAVIAQLNASVRASSLKRLASRRVHANGHGVAKIKIKLSKKARRLLRNKHTKSLSLRITVAPSLQKATHITLHPKLKR